MSRAEAREAGAEASNAVIAPDWAASVLDAAGGAEGFGDGVSSVTSDESFGRAERGASSRVVHARKTTGARSFATRLELMNCIVRERCWNPAEKHNHSQEVPRFLRELDHQWLRELYGNPPATRHTSIDLGIRPANCCTCDCATCCADHCRLRFVSKYLA